jgi:hypothetical protein
VGKIIDLDKHHNPENNRKILEKLQDEDFDIQAAVETTNQLFQQYWKADLGAYDKLPFLEWIKLKMNSLYVTYSVNGELQPSKTYVTKDGNVYPEWKAILDQEYANLINEVKRKVNVKDYGAVGDGITDDTEAFKRALGNGKVTVYVPEGTYMTKGIKLPSWTCLIGEGKGVTTIKLSNKTPKATQLITNKNHLKGNRNIFIQGMSLDWNIERLGSTVKTSAGNNLSSCLTFANVTYGWVKDVEAYNPGLHCFDVSSSIYTYFGDGTRSRGGSNYIWLDNLNGYGFGDDGITTHHSDNIFISNCHMCDPSGRSHKKGFSNSNGIEVDDGSRNVWLWNNSTARCFGGVEVKAHHNASAAANVHIIGHISLNDNRSYNFRHIGHHRQTDPASRTAYNITATNIFALAPVFTGLYKDSSPRGMVVSGYKNVVINSFTLIGDPHYDYKGNPVIAIQYRARNVVLNNIKIKDFHTAGFGIKAFGGKQRADDIAIQNVWFNQPMAKAIDIGSGIENITTANIYNGEQSSYV